jgi:hypothetical protein
LGYYFPFVRPRSGIRAAIGVSHHDYFCAAIYASKIRLSLRFGKVVRAEPETYRKGKKKIKSGSPP